MMATMSVDNMQAHSILDNIDLSAQGGAVDPNDPPKKLAVLGLPWETTEDTLRGYFGQFGPLESAEIMKDRYTGKSRGFGFVTFQDAASAQRALGAEHTIDGRRCEAKIALPKGEGSPPRTTRIFVARLPPSISEAQFRSYFEAFGKLADAYMPKDHNKQGYRGIGFVTFTSPDAVEKVMAVKHWINGHEIAIDRATPKDEPTALKTMLARLPLATNQRRSFDNGAGIIGPGLTPVGLNGMSHHLSGLGPGGAAAAAVAAVAGIDTAFTQLRSLSEDREMSSIVSSLDMNGGSAGGGSGSPQRANGFDHHATGGNGSPNGGLAQHPSLAQQQALRAQQALGLSGLGLHGNAAAAAAAAAATTAALHTLARASPADHSALTMHHLAPAMPSVSAGNNLLANADLGLLNNAFKANGLSGLTNGGSHHSNALGALGSHEVQQAMGNAATAAAVQQLMAAAAVQSSRRSLDSAAAALKRLEMGGHGISPAGWPRRAGPRIFIGKLSKETSEADVKDYFMRYGYVMDVYLPKAKDNKSEHRGFGFVTFETEAAIQRVVSHGAHRLRGSTIAIDIAMPKVEEEGTMEGLDAPPTSHGFMTASMGLMPQRI